MKTGTKVVLIVAAALAALGLMLGGIGLILASMQPAAVHAEVPEAAETVGEEQYEISGTFREISVDWVAGEVTVEPWDGDVILVEESAAGEISGRNRLYIEQDGDELEISFFRDEHRFRFPWGLRTKDLKVLIPETMLGEDMKLEMEGISAELRARDLMLRKVDAESVSGNIVLENLEASRVEAETVSGSIRGEFSACPERVELETVSGAMELVLPEDSRISVSRESAAGNFECEFDNLKNAPCRIEAESVSGSLTIRKG